MKRFIIDFILILILVLISTQIVHEDFTMKTQCIMLLDNHASDLALKCSMFVIQMIEIFFQLLYILITQWIV